MPSHSRSPAPNSLAFIADWLTAVLFGISTGIRDDAEIIDFMFSPDYQAVYSGVYELVRLPNQTPYTLFHIVVFTYRLYLRTTRLFPDHFGVPEVVENYLTMLRVFYLMALQDQDEVTLEQLLISGFPTLSQYRSIKRYLTSVVTLYTSGTLEIGQAEWEEHLLRISRPQVLVPWGGADLNDMQDTIDVLLHCMKFTSDMGDIPLGELAFPPFPHYPCAPLPPLVFDAAPLLLHSVPVSVPATPDLLLNPSSHSFAAPSTFNPFDDPIVDSGHRMMKNMTPGSAEAVYDLGGVSANVNLVHGAGLQAPSAK